jgi:hypothetical protein
VNMPADVFSQVISTELVTGEGGNKVGAKASESTEGKVQDQTTPVTESADDDLDIDGILAEETQTPESGEGTTATPVQESAEDNEGEQTPEGNGDASNPTESNEGDEPQDDIQKQLEAAQEKIKELERQLEEANNDNITLSADLTERDSRIQQLETQLKEAKQNLEVAESERDTFKQQNLKLAKYARRVLAERVVDIRIMQGKDKAEDRETLVEEWSSSTVKVLQSTIAELLKGGQRQQATVTSPGLAVQDNNSIQVDEHGNEVETQTESKKKKVTLADLEESMVSYMARSNYY